MATGTLCCRKKQTKWRIMLIFFLVDRGWDPSKVFLILELAMILFCSRISFLEFLNAIMDYFPTPVWVGTMIANNYLSIVEPLLQGKWLGYDKKKSNKIYKFTRQLAKVHGFNRSRKQFWQKYHNVLLKRLLNL